MELGKPQPPFYPIDPEQFRKTVERIQLTVGNRYRREAWADGTVYELRAVPAALGWQRFGYQMRDGTCWLRAGIVPEEARDDHG